MPNNRVESDWCSAGASHQHLTRHVMHEGNHMRQLIIFLLSIIVLCITGCKKDSSQILHGSFHVSIVNISEHDDLVITNIRLEIRGKQTVSISRKGGGQSSLGSISVEPTTSGVSGVSVVDVAVAAALVKIPGKTNFIKWLVQLSERRGNTVGNQFGSPLTLPVEAENIKDVLELSISEGFHPLSQDIEIGQFQGEPIVLAVK